MPRLAQFMGPGCFREGQDLSDVGLDVPFINEPGDGCQLGVHSVGRLPLISRDHISDGKVSMLE